MVKCYLVWWNLPCLLGKRLCRVCVRKVLASSHKLPLMPFFPETQIRRILWWAKVKVFLNLVYQLNEGWAKPTRANILRMLVFHWSYLCCKCCHVGSRGKTKVELVERKQYIHLWALQHIRNMQVCKRAGIGYLSCDWSASQWLGGTAAGLSSWERYWNMCKSSRHHLGWRIPLLELTKELSEGTHDWIHSTRLPHFTPIQAPLQTWWWFAYFYRANNKKKSLFREVYFFLIY